MCTAITYQTKGFYLGRTLDYDISYGESVTITPRSFPLTFRHRAALCSHYAMIGMAHVADGYPLYYDAMNEYGLAMAGLNFVGNAVYRTPLQTKTNLAVYELIPYLLGCCRSLQEAAEAMQTLNITDTAFSAKLPAAQLHWLVADKSGSLTVEATMEGLHVYENKPGVLTNNPPFRHQLSHLQQFLHLSAEEPANNFPVQEDLPFSRGLGAIGLPGDLSSPSRFIRAAFTKSNSISGESEEDSVTQVFHILDTVSQTRGCCRLENGKQEVTLYSACYSAETGIYYYTTYGNRQISAIDMHKTDLNSNTISSWHLDNKQEIRFRN